MIAFRDFRSTTSGSTHSDGLDKALVLANEWLVKTGIGPLNVETINDVSGVIAVDNVDRGIRIWYEIK